MSPETILLFGAIQIVLSFIGVVAIIWAVIYALKLLKKIADK